MIELESGAEFISNGKRYVINEIDFTRAVGEYPVIFTVYAEPVAIDHEMDARALYALRGAKFGGNVTLPSGRTLMADEINQLSSSLVIIDCPCDCGSCAQCLGEL